MKKNLVLILCILCLTTPAFASSQDISTSLEKHAQMQLAYGQSEKAFGSFLQALIVHPTNIKAQNNLLTFNDQMIINTPERFEFIALKDLIVHTQRLSKQLSYFEDKVSLLEDLVIKQGFNREDLAQQRLNYSKTTVSREDHSKEDLSKTNPLETTYQLFSIQEQELTQKLALERQYFEYLRQVYSQYAIVPIVVDDQPTFESTDISVSDNLDSTSFVALANKINELKERIDSKDVKVKEMTTQIIDLSLRLSEKDLLMRDQEEKINQLVKSFEELKSRFELGEKIMQTKDEQISALQQQVDKMQFATKSSQDEISSILKSQEDKLFELNGILQIYKGKLADTAHLTKEKQANITTLNEQLDIIEKHYAAKTTELRHFKDNIGRVAAVLTQIQSQLKSLSNAPKSDAQKLPIQGQLGDLEIQINQVAYLLKEQIESLNNSVPLKINE